MQLYKSLGGKVKGSQRLFFAFLKKKKIKKKNEFNIISIFPTIRVDPFFFSWSYANCYSWPLRLRLLYTTHIWSD